MYVFADNPTGKTEHSSTQAASPRITYTVKKKDHEETARSECPSHLRKKPQKEVRSTGAVRSAIGVLSKILRSSVFREP